MNIPDDQMTPEALGRSACRQAACCARASSPPWPTSSDMPSRSDANRPSRYTKIFSPAWRTWAHLRWMTQPGLSRRCAFAENDAGLIAVIEQTLPADNAREVLL
ncbi:hypothetical protein [Luteimonas terrae]|uniref:Uncharacterized protein n=1 Tax=Luteimonas terrae TaxID=1530191 RepID=A0A4R5U8H5_9GAMM|nr:hypothetical protein [Luteimonas terrae]TDK30787.1 hypothetical protein E2F49_10595 [Luteimonas terrae]